LPIDNFEIAKTKTEIETERKPALRRRLRTPAVLFLGASLLSVFFLLEHHRELVVTEPISSWTQDSFGDCAIVLTGGLGRVREGFSLLARHSVRKLIVSGVRPEVQLKDLYPASLLLGELPAGDVILERRSQTTYGNAQQSLPIFEALGCRDLVLVTTQYHMNRAYATFRSAFPPSTNILKHTLPSPPNESTFGDLSFEIVKSIFYSIWAY